MPRLLSALSLVAILGVGAGRILAGDLTVGMLIAFQSLMASFLNLCNRTDDLDFDEYWMPGHETEVYHFIGKDIVYFHTLFWPAVLEGSGFRQPDSVFAHGFLTVNGKKMSKSRGTFIRGRTYLNNLNPSYLRYYYAAKRVEVDV